jgi:hypothetical protein
MDQVLAGVSVVGADSEDRAGSVRGARGGLGGNMQVGAAS